MFSTADTIVAIATPPGRGGIGVVRLSGPSALDIGLRLTRAPLLEPRRATVCRIQRPETPSMATESVRAVDQAVVTYFPSPRSYTGDDVIEVSAHGSPVILRVLVESALQCGARLAEPGEFTLRAYLNGRIDLVQAEAVADLVDAVTPLQARLAFDQLQGTLTRIIGTLHDSLFDLIARLEASVDFPEEGYHFSDADSTAQEVTRLIERSDALLSQSRRGRLIREGRQVAILGPPNAGKSSLFNALVGAGRAIVTEIPGTTRDLLTETVDIEGIRVTLIDTAGIDTGGLRQSSDVIEKEGVIRAKDAAAVADLVLYVVDRSEPQPPPIEELVGHQPKNEVVLVANKSDLPPAWTDSKSIEVSATTQLGLDALRARIAGESKWEASRDEPGITNVRHTELVAQARAALERARQALTSGVPLSEEFVLADLQQARAALEEVTGHRTSEDVLLHIFERFCIGK